MIPYLVEELKITPILDLMHYGAPSGCAASSPPTTIRAPSPPTRGGRRALPGADPLYTPLNEPIVNALFCGKKGLWPPYLRGDAGYLKLMLQLVRGIQRTVAAIKEVDPGALMVHVEATGLARAARADLEALAVEDQRRGFLAYDLLAGS